MRRKKPISNDLVASDALLPIEVQTQEILVKAAGRHYEWLLVTRHHDFPCEAHTHSTTRSFIGDLGDALTCRYRIIAVYHRGRRLVEAEMESLRGQALAELAPISTTRAISKPISPNGSLFGHLTRPDAVL